MVIESEIGPLRVRLMKLTSFVPFKRFIGIFVSLLISCLFSVLSADPHMHRWEETGRDPDRLLLTWPGNPASSVAVSWRTNTWIKEAFAELAVSISEPRFDFNSRRVTAANEYVDLHC